MIVVLDINGVIADIRKRGARKPDDRQPDVMLPSGQPVYFRPGVEDFLRSLKRWQVVLWTSRRAVNAKPVEDALRREYRFVPGAYMHGEDCGQYQGYHPVKDASAARMCIHAPAQEPVMFVDDNPQYVTGNDSYIVQVPTYDTTSRSEPEDGNVLQAAFQHLKDAEYYFRAAR